MAGLNQKLEATRLTGSAVGEESAGLRAELARLQQENAMLRCENNALLDGHHRQLEV